LATKETKNTTTNNNRVEANVALKYLLAADVTTRMENIEYRNDKLNITIVWVYYIMPIAYVAYWFGTSRGTEFEYSTEGRPGDNAGQIIAAMRGKAGAHAGKAIYQQRGREKLG
jgi:hypothetical protein